MEDKNKKTVNKSKEEQLKDFAEVNKLAVTNTNESSKLAGSTQTELKSVLVYDLEVLPEGYDIDKVLEEYKEKGVIVYSSIKNKDAKPPYKIYI